MAIESVSPNPKGSMPFKGVQTVERPPASPEVSSIQPVPSVVATKVEQVEGDKKNAEQEVSKAIETVELMMDLRSRSVQFVKDEASGSEVIKVVDDNTGEVIRQMPTEELLGFMRNLTKMLGNFLDERV